MATDGGEYFDLTDDSKILQIDSPQENLSGPYNVVYKDLTIKWDKKPCLGIRWFWDVTGMPNGHGYSTWLVVSDEIAFSILNGLPIKPAIKLKVQDFLAGRH